MPKQSKDAVDYSAASDNPKTTCGRCVHFEAPDGCEKVEGKIAVGGWCKLFRATSKLTIRTR